MKPKILVVEDEIIIAYDIKGFLEKEYDVTINVVTVEDALIKIDEIQPDLILLDINLRADKDGITLGEWLLKKDSIPFIYITSNHDNITLDRVKDTRPYGFIVKPFKSSDLLATVYLALNNFKHRNLDVLRTEKEIIDDVPFQIKETIHFINEHITEKIEITDLANRTKWKTHHYIKVFTKYMGVTPYQYILTRKIERAKVLLSDDTIPITSIAFELGFQSYSNFINSFKKITSTTPKAFRNLVKMNQRMNENS